MSMTEVSVVLDCVTSTDGGANHCTITVRGIIVDSFQRHVDANRANCVAITIIMLSIQRICCRIKLSRTSWTCCMWPIAKGSFLVAL